MFSLPDEKHGHNRVTRMPCMSFGLLTEKKTQPGPLFAINVIHKTRLLCESFYSKTWEWVIVYTVFIVR